MASLERVPDRLGWSGFRLGLRRGLPVTPGIMAFGFVVGAAAARQGLSFFQSLAIRTGNLAERSHLECCCNSRVARGRHRGAVISDERRDAPLVWPTAGMAGPYGPLFSHRCDLVDCHALSRGRRPGYRGLFRAIILPPAVRGGTAATVAVVVALAVMAFRRNDLLAVVCGIGAAAFVCALPL